MGEVVVDWPASGSIYQHCQSGWLSGNAAAALGPESQKPPFLTHLPRHSRDRTVVLSSGNRVPSRNSAFFFFSALLRHNSLARLYPFSGLTERRSSVEVTLHERSIPWTRGSINVACHVKIRREHLPHFVDVPRQERDGKRPVTMIRLSGKVAG
jgi:hypothetical protein